jgi:hypothetical protein
MLSRRALFASPLIAVSLIASATAVEAATSTTAKKKRRSTTATPAKASKTSKHTAKKQSARS